MLFYLAKDSLEICSAECIMVNDHSRIKGKKKKKKNSNPRNSNGKKYFAWVKLFTATLL